MRLSLADLDALHEELARQLKAGTLSDDDYVHDFDRLVEFAGWTWDEYLLALDQRWEALPSRIHVFVC